MLAKFEDDVSGVVKADGTAVLESHPFKGTWGCVLLIAQTTNPADWEVRVNGSVNAIGKGSRCSLGPILLEPGDKVQLLVAGANGGSNVTGHFVGSQSDTGWHELPIPPLLPNTITSVSVPPPSTLYFGGLFGVTAGVEVTKTITVPMGAKNLLLFAGDFVTPNMFSHIKVSSVAGVGANRTYFETFAPNQPLYVIPIFPADSQILIAITTTTAGPTAGFATFISFDSLSDLQTLWHSVPPPWQAPNQLPIGLTFSLAANGNKIVIPAPPSTQRIYLHSLDFFNTATTAGCFGKWTDTAVGNAADYGDWNASVIGPFSYKYSGDPLPLGVGFVCLNQSAVAMAGFVNGKVSYSIGP